MTTKQVREHINRGLGFDGYFIRHSEMHDQMPLGALVVVTDPRDKKFTDEALEGIKNVKRGPVVQVFKQGRKWVIRRMKRVKGVWQ